MTRIATMTIKGDLNICKEDMKVVRKMAPREQVIALLSAEVPLTVTLGKSKEANEE